MPSVEGWLDPLFIDIETYSSVDIKTSGLYKYVESPDFEVLLIGYAHGHEPVGQIDLTTDSGRRTVGALEHMIVNHPKIKVAHNNAFERTCLGKLFGAYLPPEAWEDPMILAAVNGLPLSLEAAGEAFGITNKKLKTGKALIQYFCKPCKPTKTNGGRTRNLPEHAPEKWEEFKSYNIVDVEAERDLYYALQDTRPEWEKKVWYLDARINERGVQIDQDLVGAAIDVDDESHAKHLEEMRRLTGLENPNSVAQLKGWLADSGIECESLNKEAIKDLKSDAADPTITRVLELRQLLGKTSIKKYQTMQNAVCSDGRVRGLLQYYGAQRTGRWAGRLVQVQNLPQNHLDQIGTVREIVKDRDIEMLEALYDSPPDVLSQLIRTAFVAKKEHTFLVADYSAIEARVVAYLAKEKWRLDTFAAGGDIYCASATQMFHVPVEKHGENGHLRAKGKIAELALGYGGGVGALLHFDADKPDPKTGAPGMTPDEMQHLVDAWRIASPQIPKFWREAEQAARHALISQGGCVSLNCGVVYTATAKALHCRLPSGRLLSYWGARIEDGQIIYMAQNQTTRKWEKTETWGGKLVENIVQAFARDCLAVAMLRLEEAGYDIVMHVHDELIVEAPEGEQTWEEMAEIMGQPIDWAPGLLLRADGYETPFYMKD